MSRGTTRSWHVAVALVSLLALASTAGAAPVPSGLAYGLTDVRGASPGAVPAWDAPEALGDTPWWERTSMDADRDGMFDQLDDLVASGPWEPLDVLVDLDHAPTRAEAVDLADRIGARGWALFPHVRVVGLRAARPALLPLLLEAPGVVMLEPRVDAVPLQDVASRALKAQESMEYSPNTAWELGHRGGGVVVSIMDTGVDDAHPALVGKFVAGVDFTKPNRPLIWKRDGTANPDDQNGHGTTCAGIAMGTGQPTGEYVGAAPEAKLVDLRIGTRFGFSPGELPQNTYDAALQAIDWAASHSDTVWPDGSVGIDVNSLSWGIPFDGTSDGSDAYSRGLDQCVLEGIVSCVAVGNEGPDNVGMTGISASSRSIVVGALDDHNTIPRDDDDVATYSTRGPRHDDNDDYPYDELKPDVTAPGTNIMGAVYENRGDGSGGGYGNRGSGTSYATPYVAGVSALMLEANPRLSPRVLREVLRATAERVGEPEFPTLDPFWNGEYGWGMVDAYNATRVAIELREMGVGMEDIDVEMQAFVTNITGGTSGHPLMTVEGIAWARVGVMDHLEWRLDGGPWHHVTVDDGDVTFDLDPADAGEGIHVLDVRAVADDGKGSVWRPVEFTVTSEAVEASATSGVGSSTGWCVAVVVVLAISGIYIWRRRPDLVDRGLRTVRIERNP